jgi:hypothetical protein
MEETCNGHGPPSCPGLCLYEEGAPPGSSSWVEYKTVTHTYESGSATPVQGINVHKRRWNTMSSHPIRNVLGPTVKPILMTKRRDSKRPTAATLPPLRQVFLPT